MACFEVISTDSHSAARRGVLTTAHGIVQTPAFMPVGTAGAVKGITPEYLEASGAEIILANTYHLMLRPGVEVVQSLGGLHRLMAWDRPILTDSGGYQVFSLGELTKIDDEGVEFASHVDGARVRLNAEIATEIQYRMGSDIIMCFDECTPLPADTARLQRAADRTFEWAKRCSSQLTVLSSQLPASNCQLSTANRQLLFGIVQGGTDLDLRRRCAADRRRRIRRICARRPERGRGP
jgi:queuine tRNA-ribosyltransferase